MNGYSVDVLNTDTQERRTVQVAASCTSTALRRALIAVRKKYGWRYCKASNVVFLVDLERPVREFALKERAEEKVDEPDMRWLRKQP